MGQAREKVCSLREGREPRRSNALILPLNVQTLDTKSVMPSEISCNIQQFRVGILFARNREAIRFSLCCRNEGCRKRLTPPSLLFFDRKVYPAVVIILALDFCRQLGLSRQIARQTLARWRNFWQERLSETSPFMKWARGFLPPGWGCGKSPARFLEPFGFPESG